MADGEEDDELERKFSNIACPFCDPGLGPRFLLVHRLRNPESFWIVRSYWRHLQEYHSPPCSRVGGDPDRLQAYVALRFDPEDDERVLLHLGECKECHTAFLDYIGARWASTG